MPTYFYTAKSLKGETKNGVLEAKDTHQLARELKKQGFILISAETKRKKKKYQFSFGGVSLKEKLFFTRNLQVMLSAGFPLTRALVTLAEQVENNKFKKALLDIKEQVIKGQNFSSALSKHTGIFSELFQNMIKVGEESGTMEKVLKILSDQMEKDHNLISKVKGAMVYPAVIVVAMLGIGILMLITVVPQLDKTFQDLEIELPITTQFIIGLTDFLIAKWFVLIPAILFFVIFLVWAIKTKKGKEVLDNLSLKMPIISPIIKKTNSAQTIRTISSLISAGVPIVRSLEITSNVLGNIFYKKAIIEASQKVKKGEKLSKALAPYQDIYPLTLVQMLSVGEETGQTSEVLSKLADFYEDEVTNATKNLSSVIEPVLMLVIGVAVGFFAVSMIQPMYSMLGAVE